MRFRGNLWISVLYLSADALLQPPSATEKKQGISLEELARLVPKTLKTTTKTPLPPLEWDCLGYLIRFPSAFQTRLPFDIPG